MHTMPKHRSYPLLALLLLAMVGLTSSSRVVVGETSTTELESRLWSRLTDCQLSIWNDFDCAREYEHCSDVASVCRSPICDTSQADALNRLWSGMDIITFGTASPSMGSKARNRCSVGIKTRNGELIVLDAGSGSARHMGLYKCEDHTPKVTKIALTHFHSDHITDVTAILNFGLVAGRRQPAKAVKVYGPEGIDLLAQAWRMEYSFDGSARTTTLINGTCVRNLTGDSLNFVAQPFATPADDQLLRVFASPDGLLTIDAFKVPHNSISPSVGYVVVYNSTKVVFSGDTAYSPMVKQVSLDADYLIHEVLNRTASFEKIEAMRLAGNPSWQNQICNVPYAHTSIEELAEIAIESRVKNLIVTHIINQEDRDALKRAIREAGYTGRIYIAEDGDYWKASRQ